MCTISLISFLLVPGTVIHLELRWNRSTTHHLPVPWCFKMLGHISWMGLTGLHKPCRYIQLVSLLCLCRDSHRSSIMMDVKKSSSQYSKVWDFSFTMKGSHFPSLHFSSVPKSDTVIRSLGFGFVAPLLRMNKPRHAWNFYHWWNSIGKQPTSQIEGAFFYPNTPCTPAFLCHAELQFLK